MAAPSPQNPTRSAGPMGLWLPGALLGVGLVAVVALATDLVPESARTPALLGAVAAAVLGLPGVLLKLRAARQPLETGGGSPLTGGVAAVQVAVLTDFLVNALAIGGGLLGMSLAGMKFDMTAGFGLAYATVALAVQVLSGIGLARTLRSSGVPVGGPGVDRSPRSDASPSAADSNTAIDSPSPRPERHTASGSSSST